MKPDEKSEPPREGQALDLTNPKDVGLVNKMIDRHPRWRIPQEKRQWMVEQALRLAQDADDPELQVKVLELLRKFEAMNQADEHLAIKLATDAVRPPSVIEVKYRKDGVE
jgi:hypothetical protein